MNKMHLTEEMLQLVAMEGTGNHPSAKEHLRECPSCEAQVRMISRMIESVESLPTATFQFNLTDIVLESLPEKSTVVQSKKRASSGYLVMILVFVSALILCYIFRKQLLYISKTPNEITLFLISISGFVLLFLLIADMVREYDKKIEKLNHL